MTAPLAASCFCYSYSMDLKEELGNVVRDGIAALKEDRRLAGEFDSEWEQRRKGMIWSVLHEAKGEFGQFAGAQPHPENGCTNLLIFTANSRGSQNPDFRLKFCPNNVERVVKVTTSPEDLMPPDSLTLDKLTEEVVWQKLVAFAKAIFGHQLEQQRRR